MDLELSGKVSLVTGGSRGIGRATALTLAREGCGVAICARGRETLEATMAELRALHHRDPFDRMLIAQAISDRLTLVTRDAQMHEYDVTILPA